VGQVFAAHRINRAEPQKPGFFRKAGLLLQPYEVRCMRILTEIRALAFPFVTLTDHGLSL